MKTHHAMDQTKLRLLAVAFLIVSLIHE